MPRNAKNCLLIIVFSIYSYALGPLVASWSISTLLVFVSAGIMIMGSNC